MDNPMDIINDPRVIEEQFRQDQEALNSTVQTAQKVLGKIQSEAIAEMAEKVRECQEKDFEVISVASIYEGLLSYAAKRCEGSDQIEAQQLRGGGE